MAISNKIIEIIRSSIDILCECKKEKDIQNILSAQLNCQTRHTIVSDKYPNVEIDLLYFHL